MRVYIAAPKLLVEVAKEMALRLRSMGLVVVSTWHEVVQEGQQDPEDVCARREVLDTNLRELLSADAVLALTSDDAGRETYVEIGRALEMGKLVVWSIARGGDALSSSDPSVTTTRTDDEAIQRLQAISRVSEGARVDMWSAAGGQKDEVRS